MYVTLPKTTILIDNSQNIMSHFRFIITANPLFKKNSSKHTNLYLHIMKIGVSGRFLADSFVSSIIPLNKFSYNNIISLILLKRVKYVFGPYKYTNFSF
jgi:hypothetical protein